MDGDAKPKYVVLQEFAAVLLKRNPMHLNPENPHEYEAEALSILSRFVESAIQIPDDEAVVAQVATAIVKQSLDFWFDDIGPVDPEPIARELIAVYRTSFGHEPEPEVKEETKQVTEVTIGE